MRTTGKGGTMPNMKIVWEDNSFDAKLENLAGKAEPRRVRTKEGEVKEIEMKSDGSPKLVRQVNDKAVSFARRDEKGQVLMSCSNVYVDEEGKAYDETETGVFFLATDGELIPARKNDKTDSFSLTSFEPLKNYADAYLMEKYYQVIPSQGSSKKDVARQVARNANTAGMKKLWDYLFREAVMGKGILNITSAGYLPSTAYIRAVVLDDSKWTLEIAVFKQKKQFLWVEEQELVPVVLATQVETEVVEL